MSFIAAAIIGGGALIGGVASAVGASSAAGSQAGAAEAGQAISQNEFNTITGQEQPYMNAGYGAQSQLNYLLGNGTPGSSGTASGSPGGGYGSLLQPFTAQYMQQYSPAYQFQLQQGQQGVLNQDATSHGAESGAALKDLTSFNQNYANTAFSNAFNQYQTQQGNTYSRLAGIAQLGQNAAANTGQQGTALAGQAAQSATNVGTAIAGGQVGVSNAIGGAASGIGQSALLGSLYGQNASLNSPFNYGYSGLEGSDIGAGASINDSGVGVIA